MKKLIKDKIMKKKLLVLLVAVIPTLIPNLASAIAIECRRGNCIGDPVACEYGDYRICGLNNLTYGKKLN